MEKRNKVLMVSKTMSQKRAEDLERITSEYGTMLRMNRSIQAEGSFADVKFSKISVPRKSKCTGREHPFGDGTKYQ